MTVFISINIKIAIKITRYKNKHIEINHIEESRQLQPEWNSDCIYLCPTSIIETHTMESNNHRHCQNPHNRDLVESFRLIHRYISDYFLQIILQSYTILIKKTTINLFFSSNCNIFASETLFNERKLRLTTKYYRSCL